MNFGNEDLIIKSGWLTKLGGNAIRKTWKRRWFVLKGNNLYYYRDQNVKEASGVINLSLYNSISQDTTITKKSQYCIRIEKVIKESDSIHSNLSTYHDIATISFPYICDYTDKRIDKQPMTQPKKTH
ncbi:20125_t:CDS:2 [Entrophospora sp. SA101]|nr:20125_t:CDS:2 [Entrophospora sp. SA101]CAJ0848770.1 383_t:CDS:2 [Entrophospora sp. SA101]